MTVSQITNQSLAEYLRLDEPTETELALLDTVLSVAKSFIASYTGIAPENLDDYDDFAIVVFVLAQDMHDNRTLYVDKNNLNRLVETILGMHSINLL